MRRKIAIAAGIVALFALATAGVAQRAGHTVTVGEPAFSDQYLAASVIRVVAPVRGDVVAAGRQVIIDALVEEDLIVAGEFIEIRKAVLDDVRAAGRTVRIAGPVDGHVVAAGDEVRLEAGSSVDDWTWVAGRSVTVAGRVGQELRATGQRVILSGHVVGDAILVGNTIQVAPGATIGGDLILESEHEPEIAADATVTGEIIRQDFEGFGREGRFGGIFGTLLLGIGVATAVLGLVFVFPLFSEATARRAHRTPLRTLAIGLAVAILAPFMFIGLFLTGVGAIAGFGVLAAYLLSLFLGLLFGIGAVGQRGLYAGLKQRPGGPAARIVAMLLASIALLFLARIPVLGAILLLLVCILGLGALAGELWQRLRAPAAASA